MNRRAVASGCILVFVVGADRSWAGAGSRPANLVGNGSFEQDRDRDGVPDGWSTAGAAEVEQRLTLDAGRSGGRSARLTCTKYAGGTPSSHAMVCQVGKVGVKRGQWYRLTWWAKGDGTHGQARVGLMRTRPWRNVGLYADFTLQKDWQRYEEVFPATEDLPAAVSRLQFWFTRTGTLWLDDVALTPTVIRREYHPQIVTSGVRNFLPNSSFECGQVGWGGYAPDLRGWTGNVYRPMGQMDTSTAAHGRQSLRLRLENDRLPVFFFDYYGPMQEPVRTLVAAHFGWLPLERGRAYTLSCSLKADRPDAAARLMVREAAGKTWQQTVRVGREWRRHSLTFRPTDTFAWSGVGLDLAASRSASATLWLDAVQFEPGERATDYAPRGQAESFVETTALGNIFDDPQAGLTVYVVACNTGDTPRLVEGRVTITDFFDRAVLERAVEVPVEAGARAVLPMAGLLKGKTGFYRVRWETSGPAAPFVQTLRCAVIEPYGSDDSPFGMNHAYPWSFLLKLGKLAGLTWHRDWSIRWQTVQPKPGPLDFTRTDPQINRVVAEGLNVLGLFPAPSTTWSSAGDRSAIDKVIGKQTHRRQRYIEACPPEKLSDFQRYVERSVQHYRDCLRYYEVLNEPLFTGYAVPAILGYGMKDYLPLLRTTYETVKANQPEASVVGGIACWAGHRWVTDFIAADGLRWVDVMNMHLYPSTVDPVIYERGLSRVREMMHDRGQDKPIWLTEFGCYADDDPPTTPHRVGDTTMNRSDWKCERLASEALVKSSAVFLGNGIRKIFFHAGVCGAINGNDASGIFFEYGGAPRKMYAALSALANLLGGDFRAVPIGARSDSAHVYAFATQRGLLAVIWSSGGTDLSLRTSGNVQALDLMGNVVEGGKVKVGPTPVYLRFPDGDARLLEALLKAFK